MRTHQRPLHRRRRGAVRAAGLALLLAGLAACGGGGSGGATGQSGGGASGAAGARTGGTLVFGTSADPVSMDGAYVSDGESLRVVRQIFETLVRTRAGSTEIEPELATQYTPSNGGKT